MSGLLNRSHPRARKLVRALKAAIILTLLIAIGVSAYLNFSQEPAYALPSLQLQGKNAPVTACVDGLQYLMDGRLPQGAVLDADAKPKPCTGGAGLEQFEHKFGLGCYEGVTLVRFYVPRASAFFVLFDRETLKPKACSAPG